MQRNNLRIGKIELESPFLLAPLAGITDGPFRRICRGMGAAMVYSEMVSAKGLWYKDKNTGRLLEILDGEEPVAYQLFGHEPEIMAFAAQKLAQNENALIDINMGCPVPKVVKNGEGSALMKNPQLVFDVVEAAVKHTAKPVTVKIRAGWDSSSVNAVEVASAAAAAGAAAVAVHGRTREQFYSGRADRTVIAAVKHALSIPVIGNGDVTDGSSALRMMHETGCDFVMVGRGALGNPWLFRELNAVWESVGGNPDSPEALKLMNGSEGFVITPPPTIDERKEMMLRHFRDVMALKGEYSAVREMRKHVGWYLKGMPGSAAFRGRINQINNAQELEAAIKSI